MKITVNVEQDPGPWPPLPPMKQLTFEIPDEVIAQISAMSADIVLAKLDEREKKKSELVTKAIVEMWEKPMATADWKGCLGKP